MVNQLIILFSSLPIIISSNIFLYYKIFEIQRDNQVKYDEMLKLIDSLKTENSVLIQKNNSFLNFIVKIDKEQILNSQNMLHYNIEVHHILLILVVLVLIIYTYYIFFGIFNITWLNTYKIYTLKLGSLLKRFVSVDETFSFSDSSYQYKVELNRFSGEAMVLLSKCGEACEFYSLDILINFLNTPQA